MLKIIMRYLHIWVHASLYLAIPISIYFQDWIILFLTLLSLFFITITPVLFKKKKINLPFEFEWVIGFFVYTTLFLGDALGFYDRFFYWDVILHFMSGFILGIAGFLWVYALYKTKRFQGGLLFVSIFSFSFALAIGALWEIVEFAIDELIIKGTYMQHNLENTMKDLIADTSGAFLASLWGYFYLKDNKYNFDVLIGNFIKKNPDLFEFVEKIDESEQKIREKIRSKFKKDEND